MANDITPLSQHHINNKIYNFRGVPVILDWDLAELYQVEVRALNQAVKRNNARFPQDLDSNTNPPPWFNYEQLLMHVLSTISAPPISRLNVGHRCISSVQ